MKYFTSILEKQNLLYNIKLISQSPTMNVVHSGKINSVYSYYIIFNKDQYCLNNWPFLNKDEILSIPNYNYNNKIIDINEEVFLIKYEVKNVGHTFVNILLQIYDYYNNNYNCKIIILKDTLEISEFIKSIINLFFDYNKLIILDTNNLYNIKKLNVVMQNYTYPVSDNNKLDHITLTDKVDYIIYNKNEFINSDTYLDKFLKTKIINNSININYEDFKKIVIIKSENNINNNSICMDYNYSIKRSFTKEYNIFFEQNGFKIIDPSKYTCQQLYYIYNNATTIISSWGCISWINKLIIGNTNLKYVLLSHIEYTHEFKFCSINYYVPECEKCILVYNLPSEFNNDIENILTDVLTQL